MHIYTDSYLYILCMCSCMHIFTCIQISIPHTHTHTHIHTHIYTHHTTPHTHIRTHTYTHTHTDKHTHTQTNIHMCAQCTYSTCYSIGNLDYLEEKTLANALQKITVASYTIWCKILAVEIFDESRLRKF